MKKVLFILSISISLLSCKTSSHTNCDAYSINTDTQPYTYDMVSSHQSEDAKYIRENWTDEEKKDFVKRFVYKTVIINGDTLR